MKLTAFFSTLFLLLVSIKPVHACSCIEFTEQESFARSDLVFIGKVKSKKFYPEIIDDTGKSLNSPYYTYLFSVSKVLKGETNSEQQVQSGQGGGDCGYNFSEGETYKVYAYGNPVTVDICSSTERIK